LTNEDISINISNQPYQRASQQTSFVSAMDNLSLSSNPSKSTSNLRNYYDQPSNVLQKGFVKQ